MPILIALGALDDILMALMALLLLLALPPVRKFLVHLLSHLPVIGSHVSSWVDGGITSAIDYISAYLDALSASMTAGIQSLYVPIQTFVNLINDAIGATVRRIQTIETATIPNAISSVRSEVEGWATGHFQTIEADQTSFRNWTIDQVATIDTWVTNVESWVTKTEGDILTKANTATNTMGHDILQIVNVATTDIWNALKADVTNIDNAIMTGLSNVAQSAATAVNNLDARLTNEIVSVEQWVTSSIATSYQDTISALNSATATVLAPTWADLQREGDAVVQGVAGLYPDIEGILHTLPDVVPGDIAGAISALGAIALPLAIQAERCAIPNCKNLGSFPKELRNLLNLVSDGALLAFLVSIIAHPGQAEQDFADVESDIISPIVDAIKGVFG